MPEVWRLGDAPNSKNAKGRIARRAGRHEGRISARELAAMGFDTGQTARWVDIGYLVPELPKVYRIAGTSQSIESDLTAALLYAGPGAMLEGLTAGWWVGALRDRPIRISVSTPRRCRSIAATPTLHAFNGVDVRGRRPLERIWLPRNGRVWGRERKTAVYMPVTPMPQLALDLASELELNPTRKALANLEYRRLIDLRTLEREACTRGKRGGAPLKRAIARHEPKLAKTKSPGEDDLLFILEAHDVPLPDETDIYIRDEEVDAVWHAAKLIVEIDGEGNHGTWSQINRDRRKDMILRDLGYLVLRYAPEQLRDEPDKVAAEIASYLVSRTALSA
jgi:hypothetical protein